MLPPTLLLSFPAQDPQGPAPTAQVSVEAEVLANIRSQALGPATVGDLELPEEFLRRFADRVIRSSFEDHMRVVIDDSGLEPAPAPGPAKPVAAPSADQPAPQRARSWFTPLRIAGLFVAGGAIALLWILRGRKA